MITAYHGTGSPPSQIKKYGLKPLDFEQVAKDILAKYEHRKIPKWVYRAIDREIKYREGQQKSVHLTLSKQLATNYSGSSGGEFSRSVEDVIRKGLHLKHKDWQDTVGYVVAVKIPLSEQAAYYRKEPLQEFINTYKEYGVPEHEWRTEITRPYIHSKQIVSIEKVKEPKAKSRKFEVVRLDYTPAGMIVRKRTKSGTWARWTPSKEEYQELVNIPSHTTQSGEIRYYAGNEAPRFVFHIPKVKTKQGIKAYKIRETEAASNFGQGYEDKEYIWISRYPISQHGTVMVDLSKINRDNLRYTGQVEGHLLHMGDIPEEAIIRRPNIKVKFEGSSGSFSPYEYVPPKRRSKGKWSRSVHPRAGGMR